MNEICIVACAENRISTMSTIVMYTIIIKATAPHSTCAHRTTYTHLFYSWSIKPTTTTTTTTTVQWVSAGSCAVVAYSFGQSTHCNYTLAVDSLGRRWRWERLLCNDAEMVNHRRLSSLALVCSLNKSRKHIQQLRTTRTMVYLSP